LARSFQFAAISADGFDRKKLPKLLENLLPDKHINHYTFPIYDPETFARAATVMDDAILLRECNKFTPSILAAACFWKCCVNGSIYLIQEEAMRKISCPEQQATILVK
jgi:hypothetical protein